MDSIWKFLLALSAPYAAALAMVFVLNEATSNDAALWIILISVSGFAAVLILGVHGLLSLIALAHRLLWPLMQRPLEIAQEERLFTQRKTFLKIAKPSSAWPR